MKSVRMFTIGLVSGVMLATAVSAFAASEIQAVFAKFNLRIAGGTLIEIEPLVYDGTTYLPVRKTAELLGYVVSWDEATRTIELIQNESIQRKESIVMSGRQIIELLGNKYPDLVSQSVTNISLSPDGVLNFGEKKIQLQVDSSGNFDISPLIEKGILSKDDIQ